MITDERVANWMIDHGWVIKDTGSKGTRWFSETFGQNFVVHHNIEKVPFALESFYLKVEQLHQIPRATVKNSIFNQEKEE